MNDTRDAARVRQQVWLVLGAALVLYGLLRLMLGPLTQDPAYHALADTRNLQGVVSRAGDVITNLAIFAAGIFGLALRPRMTVAPEELTAVNVLIAASILTAIGSTYYHWDPANATLIWDRLGIAVVLMSLLVLVMADRLHPHFAREALWPFTGLGIASVALWGVSEAIGQEDLLLYATVRVGAGVAIAFLVMLRPPRHTGTVWLVAAILCEVAMAILERLDYEVLTLTGGVASGHNLKHVLAGIALAFVFWWLRVRKTLARRPSPQPFPR